MNRRKFLSWAGVGAAIIALPSFKFLSTSFEEAAMSLIENELNFLSLDKDGLRKFVQDYAKNKNKSFKLSVRSYSLLGINPKQSGKVNQIISTYLLSTDFFMNQMDEKRTIRYVALYNPYTRPCANPFSHLQQNA